MDTLDSHGRSLSSLAGVLTRFPCEYEAIHCMSFSACEQTHRIKSHQVPSTGSLAT